MLLSTHSSSEGWVFCFLGGPGRTRIFGAMFGPRIDSDNLERLQRESWQLELLVTGFALAGMISGADQFTDWISKTLGALKGNDLQTGAAGGLLIGASFAYLVTLAYFFIHVVLRCLWIGAIGSRSVMGQTILSRRKLAPKFERFLRRRSNFDRYINRLDDAASLIFAFTFLLIITALSILTVIFFLVALGLLISSVIGSTWAVVTISLLTAAVTLFALIYLIDFLTAGWLKRFRWFSHVYYPFYRIFGWVTFARVYRPLYYNLLNRTGGRALIYLLIPYLGVCLYLLSLEITPNRFVAAEFITEDENSRYSLDPDHYLDSQSDDRGTSEISIASQVIRSSPLRVTLPLLHLYESVIEHQCPDLPRRYAGSLHSGLLDPEVSVVYRSPKGDSEDADGGSLSPAVIECLASGMDLYLDGRAIPLTDALLTQDPEVSYSQLIKFVPLDSLSPGLHELQLRQFRVSGKDSLTVRSDVYVPFYYAPD